MSQKRYLVTGGSGFIGSSLVAALVQSGHFVRVLDNNSRGSANRLKSVLKSIEFIEADIRDPHSVIQACKGIDSVCHLAFVNGTEYFYSQPELVLEIGVKGMMNVIDGCLKHQVPELLTMSSSEVYQVPPQVPTDEMAPLIVPNPLNPRYSYGGGKIISELLTLNYGRKHFQKTLIVRPHNVYGPNMGWEHVIPQLVNRLKSLKRQNPNASVLDFPIQGTGDETRAFVYIDDFTDGMLKVLTNGENLNIYHIGTQEEVKISTLTEWIAKEKETKIRLQHTPLTQGSTPRRCPDISKVKKLGYLPKFSLKEGLTKTVPWYWENENPYRS